MTLSVQHRGSLFLAVALFLLALGIYPSSSTHDLQRALQIAMAVCALIYGLSVFSTACTQRRVDTPTAIGLTLIFGLGLMSSLLAHQPSWALTELALGIACAAIAAAFATLRRNGDELLDHALILFVLLLCLLKSTQYLYAGVLAFTSGAPVLDTDLLLTGFSNKRFYGQFQTFTLPLLALPLLLSTTGRSMRGLVFALLCVWWLIAISGGTRGTWLGIGVAGVILGFLGPWGRRWLAWQCAALCGGLLLYWLVFVVLTGYLGIGVGNPSSGRLTTSLSGRGPLWWQAWDMIRAQPLLGFGPMHFADIANDIAAHPHQAILQWASEWGVPSTLCVVGLALRGLWSTVRLPGRQASEITPTDLLRLCLFAALVGALVQAMVDGVIVMPISQLWLALVVGWLMALHPWRTGATPRTPRLHGAWMALVVLSVAQLVFVAVRDLPHANERNQRYVGDSKAHLQPRFWAQGVIAPHMR